MDKMSLLTVDSSSVHPQVLVDLYNKVQEIHKAHADDLCWMDIDEIFKVVGLPVPDRRVGDKAAMKKNCDTFIDVKCTEGHWKSYVELEKENQELREENKNLQQEITEFEEMLEGMKEGTLTRITDLEKEIVRLKTKLHR